MKVFAFYLPQFHEIPENNNWWGKGFTEWTNVRKAKPLFLGHNQPNLPLNNNFYDLTNVDTIAWQIDYAKTVCGLTGFSIYHYYFGGKVLLDSPSLLILNNKKLNIDFFFTWANEPWTRAWDGKQKEVLIDQYYGDSSDFIHHFNYLLPFFKDERYTKINNKPVFAIYKSKNIQKLNYMIKIWNELSIFNGFSGIHWINVNRGVDYDKRELFDADLIFEPTYTQYQRRFSLYKNRLKNFLMSFLHITLPNIHNIDIVYRKSIKLKIKNKNSYLGAFINWDNSPRRGNKSVIFKNFSIKKFDSYFKAIIKKAKNYNNEFLFINAWNEWAEGTFIEPSKFYGDDIGLSIKESINDCKN